MLGSDLGNIVVYSRDMVKLGVVKDFEIDPAEMKVTSLIIKLEDPVAEALLDKRPRLRAAEGKASTSLVDTFKDAIVLKEPLKELKGSIQSL